jgi:hypothetical protein
MRAKASFSTVMYGLVALLLVLSSGCTPPVRAVPQEEQAEVFIPPTLVVTPAPTMTSTAVQPRPTPTIDCTSDLKFLDDLTIPDGTQVGPGEEVVKRWEVENTGTCNWDERFSLVNVEGPELGVEKKQSLFPARSGSQAILQVTFNAPAEPGTYRSVWQAAGPDGQFFGERFYVEFVVP